LDAAHRKTSLSFQRLQLEIESLKTQEKEWKSRVADWQSLEKRSDKELDKLAEKKQELETKVRELEKEMQELRKKEKGSEKEKQKMAALEKKIDRLEDLLADAQEKTSEAQQEAHDAQTELGRVQKQLVQLQSQAARDISAVPGGSHKPPSSTTAVAMEQPPSPALAEPQPANAKRGRKSRKVAPKTLAEPVDSPLASDAEPDKSDAEGSDFYDAIPGRTQRAARKTAAKGQSAAGVKRTASKMEKAKSRGKPVQEEDEKENDGIAALPVPMPVAKTAEAAEEEDGQKKKKRKLFGPPSAAPFQWAAGLNTGDGADSIIPSILSPIKGGKPAPQRAGMRVLGLTSGRIF